MTSLYCTQSFATVDSPVVQGLAGASRAGVPREAIFSNPASVSAINGTFAFLHYQIPQIADFNAGGRAFSAGVYDGGDKNWKGGFGYSRTAKAAIQNNSQGYIDRRELRFATGHAITESIQAGVAARWINNYAVPGSDRFFEGDLGILFPLFADLRGGITYENILNKEDDSPTTAGVGATYALGYGFQLFADGYRLMSGTKTGERGWSLATEASLSNDFFVRGGLFEEAYRALKGWSLGATWMGPKASFDYAMKIAGKGPKEKTHILGMTLTL